MTFRLRLRSFGPLWTISTWNQWKISEVGRLSCLIDFFVLFHIVCDRYTSDYAHFTFPTPFDHFHFHQTLGLDSALILILRPNLFEAMFSNSDYELWAKFTLSSPNCKEWNLDLSIDAHHYHFSPVNTMSGSDHVAFRDQAACAKGKLPPGLHLE